jgi:GNAT superfamily N-acetyltransferase
MDFPARAPSNAPVDNPSRAPRPAQADIRLEPASSPNARFLIAALDADISSRYPGGPIHGINIDAFESAGGLFYIAYLNNAPAACGALRPFAPNITEIKRMFVHATHRRQGLARQMLAHLERQAATQGYPTARLETGQAMHEALALYRSAGWKEIPLFGEYVHSKISVCFEKQLGVSS